MLPDPLHPAVVHFPIVLTFLLPIVIAAAMWAIRKGAKPARAWAVPVAFSLGLAASAWAAVETGEGQEDRVENIVPGAAMDSHEDAANLFLKLSAGLALIAAAGLIPRVVGRSARLGAAAGAVGLIFVGIQVGRSGGDLVYVHGAASAYSHVKPTDPARRVSQSLNLEGARRDHQHE